MLFEPTAEMFYKLFTPIRGDTLLEIPESLVPFAEALSKYEGVPLQIESTPEGALAPPYESDPTRVAVLLSGGVDSAWSLLYALENGLTPYPIFIEGLNRMASPKEKSASEAICTALGLKLFSYKHATHLKRLHRDSANAISTPESLVKLPYALLLSEGLLKSERVGGILITSDLDDPDWAYPISEEWWSDTAKCFQLFLPYLERYLGTSITLLAPQVSKPEKIKALMDKGLFELTFSCMINPMYFASNQKRSGVSYKNMCGVCWKCKENLRFIKRALSL